MDSTLITLRQNNTKNAILFIHGFLGSAQTTWSKFPEFLIECQKHKNWDIFSLRYPTSLSFEIKNIWKADPDLPTLANELRTKLTDTFLSKYEIFTLIAHSMGGLIVQRALIDLKKTNKAVFNKISHVFLFCTPSNGLYKASIVANIKRQFQNMGQDSDFIKELKKNRDELFTDSLFFRVIAGDQDEFVPKKSSIYPFPEIYRKVVPGDHLSAIKPESAKSDSVQIVINGLSNKNYPSFWDSAIVEYEKRKHIKIVEDYLKHADQLDDKALVLLALSLDELSRREDAIKIIEQRNKKKPTLWEY